MEPWVAITILAFAALGAWTGYTRFVKEVGKEKAKEVPDTNEVNRLMALAGIQKFEREKGKEGARLTPDFDRENWGTEEMRALYDRKIQMITETACLFAGIAALVLILILALGAGYNEYL
jgi:hypothetical protein